MTTLIAFDTETHLIGPGNIVPRLVCAIFTERTEDGALRTEVIGNHPDEWLELVLEELLQAEDVRWVTHNGGFDWAVVCGSYPNLIPLVFSALIDGRCTDTLWREKLLNLSTTGRLDEMEMPDGSRVEIRYGLAALVLRYLGEDISAEKSGEPDTWRLNFAALDGWRSDEYPEEAHYYAAGDGEHTLRVYEAQEARAAFEEGSFVTQEFQLAKSVVLRLATAWGMEVDQAATDAMEAATTAVIEANKSLLEEQGILRPANMVGEPYAKDLPRALAILEDLVQHGELDAELPIAVSDILDWAPLAEMLKARGIKFRKAKGEPGSKDTKRLQAYLEDLYRKLGEIPTMTPGGSIQCDAEVQEYLATKDPVMAQYHERQSLQKIVTQMIPALRAGPVVYPDYDALKETGRISSYDGGKARKAGEPRLYASVNITQIPNEIRGLDPRRCFKPRAGRAFFDVDVTGLELAAVGDTTYKLFGKSVHRDLYNDGVDLHAYLGAQLALGTDEGMAREFAQLCRSEGILAKPMAVYEAFRLLKKHESEEVRAFYKHYRTFAKPVGLGYPGGLGPATQVTFARQTYGVIMTEEQARDFREMWKATYPEMPRFFDWVNAQTDQANTTGEHTMYRYTTPLGMVRVGASYCAAANGACMQSPGAEAALAGMIQVSRACYDPTMGSVLYGARPIGFIHDQIVGETTADPELWAPQCEEVARLIRESASMILSSVNVRTDEALLTTVWSKAAEPVRDSNGKLIPWQPKETKS